MDSIDSLLAIQLPPADSESSSSASSTTSNNNGETDIEDNVNNEDDPVDDAEDEDNDGDQAIIYGDDVVNSAGSSSRYNAITDNVVATTPQTSAQLPIALSYSTPPLPTVLSSSKTSRGFVPASSTAAAAAAKGPPTPIIVTATPLPSLGPLRPQTEYEPAASVAATRLSAQYTDTLRRRAETLMQKRLRMQKESVQKSKEIRQLTSRLAELNSRLADELVEQKRLVADYDRIRETARRALGVLHVVRDAEAVLVDTKERLLSALTERDYRRPTQQHEVQQPAQIHHPPVDSFLPNTDDDNTDNEHQMSAAATYDPFGLD